MKNLQQDRAHFDLCTERGCTRNPGLSVGFLKDSGTRVSLIPQGGEKAMEFVDRFLKCTDCGTDFVFTAGEQLFFFDKQFKNDPKRCKLCKAKRAGLGRTAAAGASVALPLSRTETRTKCSSCGVDTTVPFKPTQGRPVLCRSCFQTKRVPSAIATVLETPAEQIARQSAALEGMLAAEEAETMSPGLQSVTETPMAAMNADATQADPELAAAIAEPPQA